MKSTKEVKQKLLDVMRELDWIESLLRQGKQEHEPWILRNGKPATNNWTMHEAQSYYITKRMTLEWVLGYK